MSAGTIYYIVISGYQAAAGQYQLDVQSLDGSPVAGSQLRGSFAVAPPAATAAAAANASHSGPPIPSGVSSFLRGGAPRDAQSSNWKTSILDDLKVSLPWFSDAQRDV